MFNKQRWLNKALFNSEIRKNIFFRRNLHINGKETNIKICRVKTWDDLYIKKEGFNDKWVINNIVFFLYHQQGQYIVKNIQKIKTHNCDIVVTDSSTNKIISFYPKLNNLLQSDNFYNVWIFEKDKSVFLNLKNDDIVFTR